jgi:PBP1b-binding outer membrane lipoprotein LpoB
MSVSKYINFLLIILLLTGCSNGDKDISPDIDEAIESSENTEESPSFLETAEPFYPLKETVEDIQTQLNDLHARVIEYETRVSTPSFNTEVLKMIKVPQLNHEINLTNGTLIQGTIIQENMDQLIVQTQIGQLTIDKGNVESIKEIAPATAKIDFDGDADEKIMAESRLYSGTVTNTGLDRADFVRIIYQLWGGETDLISSDSTFIEGAQVVYQSGIITDTALRPGETAEFFLEIKSPSDKKVQYVTRDIHWDSYE